MPGNVEKSQHFSRAKRPNSTPAELGLAHRFLEETRLTRSKLPLCRSAVFVGIYHYPRTGNLSPTGNGLRLEEQTLASAVTGIR